MPEQFAEAESVTSTDESVTVTPALLNKPVRPEDPSTNEVDLVKHKLGLANQHAKRFKTELEDSRRDLEQLSQKYQQLQEAQQNAIRENLEGQGAYKELAEQERQRNKELETTLLRERAEHAEFKESVTRELQQDRLKSSSMTLLSQSNAVNPAQLYTLLQSQLRTDDDGNPVVLNSGVEQPLGDYLTNLKQAAEWQHHFGASSARGMGSTPAAASVAPGMTNPYKTRNLTEAMKLEATNPELAKQLKAEALSGS